MRRPMMADRMEQAVSYTKRMKNKYEQRSPKMRADKETKEDESRSYANNVVGFRQPDKSA